MGEQKGNICRKYMLRAVAVVWAAAAGLCGGHVNAEGNHFPDDGKRALVRRQEERFYPTEEEAVRLFESQPVFCTPVEETYGKYGEEPEFSAELLADLQEYVRRGEEAKAIDAYRDETLLVDGEELRRICPEYDKLLSEWLEERWNIAVSAEDVTDNIMQIYKLKQNGEKEALLLLAYNSLKIPWCYIEKKGDEYQIGTVRLEEGPNYDFRGKAVFADEKGYCLLLRAAVQRTDTEEEEMLILRRFTLQDEEGESSFVIGSRRYIRARITRVHADFFYVNNSVSLMPAVREYVEENAAVFADRLFAYEVIWGDEEGAKQREEDAEILWTESGEQSVIRDWHWTDYICQADYNNDGRAELFWRIVARKENALLLEEASVYRTVYIRFLGRDILAERLWFVEFAGKTVTFEIAEPYGPDCPILSAYLIEGNKYTPLLTCQLVYGKTVEIDAIPHAESGEDNFGIKSAVPLIAGLEEETREQAAFRARLTPWIRAAAEEAVITFMDDTAAMEILSGSALSAEGGAAVSADFLAFIREGAAWSLSGKLFSAYAAPYEVDTEKDFAEFMEKYDDSGCIDMVYRWEAKDGSSSYLVSELLDFDSGINTLYRYWDNGEGEYQKEAITDMSAAYGSYCGVLSYGGQRYCVVVSRSNWIFRLQMEVIVLGDAGEWEHYCVSFTRESKEHEILSFDREDTPAALTAYVAEEAEEIFRCTDYGEIYEGRGACDELPKEVWRNIKNRDLSYAVYSSSWSIYGHNRYREVDADNDGEPEYAASYHAIPNRGPSFFFHTMYGWRDGVFVELSLGEGILNSYRDRDDSYEVFGSLEQLWFEELDGVTYLFTVEKLYQFDSYLLRVRLIKDGRVQDMGAWLFRYSGDTLENIEKMEEYESWMSA